MRYTYKAIVTRKSTGDKYEASAIRVGGIWLIGGNYPNYKDFYYNIFRSDGVEFELKYGRAVRV